ncbi:Bax inhibitor-1/YccA family protein [Rufibacter sp. LB8]|uniref:Bax inhibitor-1/YccA family protein n=1 Tax=Rufibacter sp. LB8 TaxID=2777781 RepID=UPI00178C25F4|nr:Bax inhibitor-1/YccA family protein [Rufibacter sp. LB8]
MSFFSSNNPALKEEVFTQTAAEREVSGGSVMTLNGTMAKAALMLGIVFTFALFAWDLFAYMGVPVPYLISIPLIGVGLAFLITYKKHLAAYIAPIYCALQGLFLGGVSGLLELKFPGIATQAMLLTFTIFGSMLLLYSTRLIRVTERFKSIIITATFGIFVFYMASFALSFFGVDMPLLHSSGMAGIIFSVFVVILAAMNLLLDFDTIETGMQYGAPKYMEWYAAFGLTVTLIWLYVEILRLLSKLNSRN